MSAYRYLPPLLCLPMALPAAQAAPSAQQEAEFLQMLPQLLKETNHHLPHRQTTGGQLIEILPLVYNGGRLQLRINSRPASAGDAAQLSAFGYEELLANYQAGTDVTACVEKEKLREANDYLPLDFQYRQQLKNDSRTFNIRLEKGHCRRLLSENTPEQIRRKRDLSSVKLAIGHLNSTLPQDDGIGLVLHQIVLENDTVHYRYRLSPSVQESAFIVNQNKKYIILSLDSTPYPFPFYGLLYRFPSKSIRPLRTARQHQPNRTHLPHYQPNPLPMDCA